MSEKQTCARRMSEFGPWDRGENLDTWDVDRDGFRTCSFCGSLHPDDVLAHLRNGVEIHPTDKNYKGYLMAPDPKAGQRRIDGMSNANERPGANWIQVTEEHLPELRAAGWGTENKVGQWMLYAEHSALAQVKFYYQHFNEEHRREFIEMANARKLNIGYPGHFYVLPFFCKREG